MSRENNIIISAENLTKIFKDFWNRPKAKAVNDISFEVKRGEVVGLLGPNGSGKSTTIKMILNLLYPTSGELKIFGRDAKDVSTKSKIGYLSEETYLYKFLSAKETLNFFGHLFRLSEKDVKKRTYELLEMFGMSHVRKRLVGEFSKGMARRIGMAQALINNPELLILDEPTSGLDPVACKEMKNLISFLKSRGKTILVSSHLLSDIEEVCDRIIILYGGKIVVEGRMEDLLKIYERNIITIPNRGDEQTEKLQKYLREELRIKDFNISNPSMSLEKYFMRTMEETTNGNTETAGAKQGNAIAEYLNT